MAKLMSDSMLQEISRILRFRQVLERRLLETWNQDRQRSATKVAVPR
jgi:hypothetical protein